MVQPRTVSRQRSLRSALFPQVELEPPLAFLNRPSRLRPTVVIGGRSYREFDNGIANVLVPVRDPSVSPTDAAERRRGAARAIFMTEHPLGSAAYTIATLANATPRTRDAVLVAGGAAETAMLGAALGVAPVRGADLAPARREVWRTQCERAGDGRERDADGATSRRDGSGSSAYAARLARPWRVAQRSKRSPLRKAARWFG